MLGNGPRVVRQQPRTLCSAQYVQYLVDAETSETTRRLGGVDLTKATGEVAPLKNLPLPDRTFSKCSGLAKVRSVMDNGSSSFVCACVRSCVNSRVGARVSNYCW